MSGEVEHGAKRQDGRVIGMRLGEEDARDDTVRERWSSGRYKSEEQVEGSKRLTVCLHAQHPKRKASIEIGYQRPTKRTC